LPGVEGRVHILHAGWEEEITLRFSVRGPLVKGLVDL
jgi:hypothetical protein